MSSSDPYLLIEQCGSKYGRLIYVITEHIPASGGYPASTVGQTPLVDDVRSDDHLFFRKREIRCMDLGMTALGNWKAQQGGCTHIQFFNEINDLKNLADTSPLHTRPRIFASAFPG
ncbi:hypothetical protein DFH94DRAFT_694056 [Russula ochroleuca]|uniref:Uncharacterized protein n=1 Tax=Russula ochroleuca TaxID=152965 RepID=A0A9P5MU43_9AGAM|nr:hypothetical protein DFH94DRAFT_694056 [Russula ochroleuca]